MYTYIYIYVSLSLSLSLSLFLASSRHHGSCTCGPGYLQLGGFYAVFAGLTRTRKTPGLTGTATGLKKMLGSQLISGPHAVALQGLTEGCRG